MMQTIRRHLFGLISVGMLLAVLGCGCMKSDGDWKSLIGNKKLTSATNSGALSSKTEIYLCPNGDFAMVVESSGFSTGGAGDLSMADRKGDYGKWSISNGQISFKSQSGENAEFALSQGADPNVVSFGGNDYLLGDHDKCR